MQADPIPARAKTNSTGSPPLVCSATGRTLISSNAVYRALCLAFSLKSRIALPRMCLGHDVKIANITDLSELEVGNPENDN